MVHKDNIISTSVSEAILLYVPYFVQPQDTRSNFVHSHSIQRADLPTYS